MTKSYLFKLATSSQEVQSYFALRQAIFCREQQLFASSDEDELDQIAYPIVAIATNPSAVLQHLSNQPRKFLTTSEQNASPFVVGVVRIYEQEPGLWYGGRLGVHQDYRRVGSIGKGLIEKAVTTANTWGCHQFLATVQLPNVRFFQRLHWHSVEEIMICGQPHQLMEADLSYYPPGNELRPTLLHSSREAS